MIQGIGIDILEIERFQQSIGRFGDRILKKVFTDNEIQYCSAQANSAGFFAAGFAAKEALSKALETGNTGIFTWKDIEVIFNSNGRTTFIFYNWIAERLKLNNTQLTLSISADYVTAFVVLQTIDRDRRLIPDAILDPDSALQYL